MAHEAAAGAKAIKANLSSLSMPIFGESAKQGALCPYVVFRMRSPGDDSQVLPDKRAMTSPLFDVGVWVADDPYSTDAQAAAKEIDEALGALAGYLVTDANGDQFEVSFRREGGAWIREEIDVKAGGKKFYWVGGSYRGSISQA
jgi:hypothetical protein